MTILNTPDWNKYKYELAKPKPLYKHMKARFVDEWYRDTKDGVIFSKDLWNKIRDKDKYEVVKVSESIITVKYKEMDEV